MNLSVVADPTALDLFDLLDQLEVDPFFIVDITAGIRAGNDLPIQLMNLFYGVDRNIA